MKMRAKHERLRIIAMRCSWHFDAMGPSERGMDEFSNMKRSGKKSSNALFEECFKHNRDSYSRNFLANPAKSNLLKICVIRRTPRGAILPV